MKITRTSVLTGITRTKEIPVNPEDMANYVRYDIKLEEAFPYASDADREFILSGITQEEWDRVFRESAENA